MVFKLARTFKKPSQGANVARGFPTPGAGDQTVGDFTPSPRDVAWSSDRPIQGYPSWANPDNGGQRGTPAPLAAGQARRGWGAGPPASGLPKFGPTMRQSYGAGGAAPQYGKVLTNPIGAGVVARYRPQASYGPAGQYQNGAIWWTSQAIPTSVNLQGLTRPQDLAAVLGPINVQAVVRTTG